MGMPFASTLNQQKISQKTVVLVEDDSVFREFFSDVLQGTDDLLLLGVAQDLAAGLSLLEGAMPDVLLVDLGLPDGSGLDLILAARKQWEDRCHIMVISVLGDDYSVIQAFEYGAEGYLLKNSSARNFAQDIRDLIAGGSPVSPVIAKRILERFKQKEAKVLTESQDTKTFPKIKLSPREKETLLLLSQGFTKKEVAKKMTITAETVKSNLRQIFHKMYVDEPGKRRSVLAAADDAKRWGIL